MDELKPTGFETADALDRLRAVRRGMPYKTLWPSDVDEAIEALEEKLNRRPVPENKPLLLPAVSERDRQSVYDFLHDCFAEWISDPSVGLCGMNAGEAVLANSIMSALASGSEESKPLTPERLPELVGNPIWISGINQYGILGRKGVDADDDGNLIFRYVVGFAFGWEWLEDVLTSSRKAYACKPEQEAASC